MDERDDLKRRLDGYLSEISRLERLLTERDRERDLLNEQLRTSNEDAEVWRSRWEKAEATASTVRADCDEKELELARNKDGFEARDRELAQLKAAMTGMEAQVSTKGKTLSIHVNQQVNVFLRRKN